MTILQEDSGPGAGYDYPGSRSSKTAWERTFGPWVMVAAGDRSGSISGAGGRPRRKTLSTSEMGRGYR
jgi:hypothetical protein